MYGKELILDLKNCDYWKFTKEYLESFFEHLCELIKMERVELHIWEDHMSDEPHLRGISAVQFIKTSNIVIHTLEIPGTVYLNIFTCKDFDTEVAEEWIANWFNGTVVNSVCLKRGIETPSVG